MTSTHIVLLALSLLGVLPGAAASATLRVANDGVDGPDCGSRRTPCRSIGRAIAHAADGATILVGPGRYGPDVESASRSGGEDALVSITKAVRLVSRDGAGATILDADGQHTVGVSLEADGAVLGRRNRGFTVTGAGIGVLLEADHVRTEGNWVVENDTVTQGSGMRLASGTGHVVVGNTITDNDSTGISVFGSEGYTIAGNRVSGHRSVGIFARESSGTITGNAVGSEAMGMRLEGDHRVDRNLVVGSDESGILLDGATDVARYRISGNTVTGSGQAGVHLQKDSLLLQFVVTKNALYGNGPGLGNCGLLVEEIELATTIAKNFWGVSGGPDSVEPADDACAGTVVTGPFARTERRVRPKSAR